MKNIKFEDEQYIKDLWAYIFLNIFTCKDFDELKASDNFGYCPICMEDRVDTGLIRHKSKYLLIN